MPPPSTRESSSSRARRGSERDERTQTSNPTSPSTSNKSGSRAKRGSGKSQRSDGKDSKRKERSGSGTSSNRDRDAKNSSSKTPESKTKEKQKLRLAEADESLRSPGVIAVKDGTPNSRHRQLPSKTSDAENKQKLRLAAAVGELPFPGATDQSTPGAHHAEKDRSRKGGKGRPSRSGTSSDLDRDAKNKGKRSSGVPSSPVVAHVSGNTQEDRAARKASRNDNRRIIATANAVEDAPDASQVQVELTNGVAQNDRNHSDDGASQQEPENKRALSRNRKWKRWAICILVTLSVIGGAIAAVFLTRRSKFLEPASTALSSGEPSSSPSSSPSNAPSTNPTFFDLYDAPDEDTCIKVAQNRTTDAERALFDQFDFGLIIDVTLEVNDDMSEPQVFTVAKAFQEKLAPLLLGCDEEVSRRSLESAESQMVRGQNQRKLDLAKLLGKNRFIVADAFVNGMQIEDQCTKTEFPETCHRVFMELSVFLKGPIRLLDIIFLISEKVEEQLLEEGVGDNNLKKPLRLEYPFFNLQLVDIANLSPTTSPSSMPTNVPSLTPSDVQSDIPSVRPTARPVADGGELTAMPVDKTEAQSKSPSEAPSPSLTLAPVSGPTLPPTPRPTPVPSKAPSGEPSILPSVVPSLAPVIGPTPPPSAAPSRFPSDSPSTNPSNVASSLPTVKPSSKPSMNPSSKPSKRPSASPSIEPATSKPSTNPSSKPSNRPSKNPSPKPSMNPSMAPSRCLGCQPTNSCTGTDQDAIDIGCGSCSANGSCLNLVAVVNTNPSIGEKSCTVADSCSQATLGTIGDESCTTAQSCRGRPLTVGAGSCKGQYSCDYLGDTGMTTNLNGRVIARLTVGAGACTGLNNGCLSQGGTVGDTSCTGFNACAGRKALSIGNKSCMFPGSCSSLTSNGSPDTMRVSPVLYDLTVPANSCNCQGCCTCMVAVILDATDSATAGVCNVDGACCPPTSSPGGGGQWNPSGRPTLSSAKP